MYVKGWGYSSSRLRSPVPLASPAPPAQGRSGASPTQTHARGYGWTQLTSWARRATSAPSPTLGRASGNCHLAGGVCNVENSTGTQEPPAQWRNPSNPLTPLPGTPASAPPLICVQYTEYCSLPKTVNHVKTCNVNLCSVAHAGKESDCTQAPLTHKAWKFLKGRVGKPQSKAVARSWRTRTQLCSGDHCQGVNLMPYLGNLTPMCKVTEKKLKRNGSNA